MFISPPKGRRLRKLEQNWKTHNEESKPRRHEQMTKDIKHFIFRSIDGDLFPEQDRNKPGDIFGKISATFGFAHHEGTEAKAEMAVVKVILVREGLLMKLQYLDEQIRASAVAAAAGAPSYPSSGVLDLLAQVRESTLNYLEALCLWRAPDAHTLAPRVFCWEGRNYTLKVVSDLDFLADNSRILRTLKIPPAQLRSNPLMLTNNLDDPHTWMDPVERAGQDCGGAKGVQALGR
ncbi:hypothetical protein B484DRAFT_403709 [Ochromonadaceae sp. CCMP2298]|nr:hypothetical protein B484DRAFT_403709 [Ochromonadaceae sp. CCMP2298]